MPTPTERVKRAIHDLQLGKMIILTDDPSRENEGDLIVAAEKVTPENMNFMIRQGTGIVCLSMPEADLAKLQLPLMLPPAHNSSCRGTPFTISIDAKDNITTGVSASDRVQTVLAAIDSAATPDSLVRPGHIFPLQAQADGVLARQGHTEGAVDLMKLAGFKPAAVLCEIMNQDGTMARGAQLVEFGLKHQLNSLSISDILHYRYTHEDLITDQASTILPLENYGQFKLTVVKEKITRQEHMVLINDKHAQQPVLVRVHSACITGDLFSSKRCDCNNELHYSLKQISEHGGILIYLNQEGRGIGLLNKIKAYALQDQGFDTVEANEKLGLPIDSRSYYIAANILRNLNIHSIRLLTNNPHKISELNNFGIQTQGVPLPAFENEFNQHYLKIKREKMNHTIHLGQGQL